MSVQEIGEFKYPDRKPVILLILVVVIAVLAWRWHRSGHQIDPDSAVGRWSCAIQKKVKLDKGINKTGRQTAVIQQQVNAPAPVQTNLPVSAATADTNAPAALREAIALEENKQLLKARRIYQDLLKTPVTEQVRQDVETRIGRINWEIVLSPVTMSEKQEYVVQAGDSLDKIARKFSTTTELIQKSNLLKSDVIKVGDRLIVLSGKFVLKVSKVSNDMVVTLNDTFFCRFKVGTGKFGKTPVGSFVINDKIREPVWWRPDGKEIPFGDPENILGTRWMSIKASGSGTPDVKGYGIHGTWDDGSIGKAESAGCIRMKNGEVEQLFTVLPIGTVVTITE